MCLFHMTGSYFQMTFYIFYDIFYDIFMFLSDDMFMYSRYMGYRLEVKLLALIPSILGFVMFFTLITLYGRFPPNEVKYPSPG